MNRWIARLCRWARPRRGLRGTPHRAARRFGPTLGRAPAADLLDVRLPSLELALDRKGLFGEPPDAR